MKRGKDLYRCVRRYNRKHPLKRKYSGGLFGITDSSKYELWKGNYVGEPVALTPEMIIKAVMRLK